MSAKTAVIIGAGPAGLTAAYELLTRTDIVPVVLEMSDCVGGIARTVNYKGNRIDIGGHRFFSKSDRVMQWWLDKLPLEQLHAESAMLKYQGQSRELAVEPSDRDPEKTDRVMLVRSRKSRIYFLRKFFDYPLRLNLKTLAGLGPIRTIKIGCSYLWSALFGPKKPTNLEEFFVSRFGRELYLTFFKSYTEKVWGESCSNISAEWGAQRIKGLSIAKAIRHFFRGLFKRHPKDITQKQVETSLIEQFLYPKHGPGQMWEVVAAEVVRRGGKVIFDKRVSKLHVVGDRIAAVEACDVKTGAIERFESDFVFSTMPVKELIQAIDCEVPAAVREVASGLIYRDFITVGLLMKKLKVHERGVQNGERIRDNWIYIQEPDVQVGRLQVFNNWSPYMVADPSTTWIGLEYFCYETDALWKMPDEELIEMAKAELERIGMIDRGEVMDATVLRMPKTYPAYFGTYGRFEEIRTFVDGFSNLYLIGRNGMHKYNNQDHSMLAAMVAVDNIAAGSREKANVWEVNTEQEYHEDSSGD